MRKEREREGLQIASSGLRVVIVDLCIFIRLSIHSSLKKDALKKPLAWQHSQLCNY